MPLRCGRVLPSTCFQFAAVTFECFGLLQFHGKLYPNSGDQDGPLDLKDALINPTRVLIPLWAIRP